VTSNVSGNSGRLVDDPKRGWKADNVKSSIHILMGLWIAFIGYSLTQKRKLYPYEKIILIVLGTIAILYQAWLWIKFPKDNYAYNVPGWLLHLCHILVGAFFISVAVLKKPPHCWGL
jgi:hypothetical protein